MEIKSCPFCGAKANIFEHESRYAHGDSQWHIECPACHAASKLCDSESVAIELWGLRSNQRTAQDDIHKAAYLALDSVLVAAWVTPPDNTSIDDWRKAIHALVCREIEIAQDPRVGGTAPRTAKDEVDIERAALTAARDALLKSIESWKAEEKLWKDTEKAQAERIRKLEMFVRRVDNYTMQTYHVLPCEIMDARVAVGELEAEQDVAFEQTAKDLLDMSNKEGE